MKSDNRTRCLRWKDRRGPAVWFLNTLTIIKVSNSHGQLSIIDHRMPPGHRTAIMKVRMRCSSRMADSRDSTRITHGAPGPALWCSRRAPSRTASPPPAPARAGSSSVVPPGGFDESGAAAGESAPDLRLPGLVRPDPDRLTQLATATAFRSSGYPVVAISGDAVRKPPAGRTLRADRPNRDRHRQRDTTLRIACITAGTRAHQHS
jgi:hypothetical protein